MKKQKMKTFVLSCLIFLGLSSVVLGEDQYFYWNFDWENSVIDTIDNAWEKGARMGLVGYSTQNNPYNVTGHLGLYYNDVSPTTGDQILVYEGMAGNLVDGTHLAKFEANPEDYFYFIELVNENGGLMGYYSLGGYAALTDYIVSADQQIISRSPWSKTDYKAIPEPTSGLLLLLGVAGLALRRKVRKS